MKLVREGNTRDLFKDRSVVSFLTGEPEYLDPLKDETPDGWIVTGYPWNAVAIPEHAAFLKAYQAKYNDYPRLGSVVGYSTLKAAAAILAKANSTDSEKLVDAAEGIAVDTPFGKITFRKADHQSTLGAFVGKTALKDGKGVMVDVTYRDGGQISAPDERSEGAAAAELTAPGRPPPPARSPATESSVTFYFDQFVTGLASASSLFLAACGLSIIFGVTRIVNFAHGAFYMLGAYVAFTLDRRFSGAVGFWARSFSPAMIVAALGALIEIIAAAPHL